MKALLFFTISLCLFSEKSWSKVDVQSYFDREEVAVGDTFTYTVSVASSESVGVEKPQIDHELSLSRDFILYKTK